jgi:hypothetical protein
MVGVAAVTEFMRRTVLGRRPVSNGRLPEEIARALDAAADDVRHDRTEDIHDYVKRKEAELEAHIARENARKY